MAWQTENDYKLPVTVSLISFHEATSHYMGRRSVQSRKVVCATNPPTKPALAPEMQTLINVETENVSSDIAPSNVVKTNSITRGVASKTALHVATPTAKAVAKTIAARKGRCIAMLSKVSLSTFACKILTCMRKAFELGSTHSSTWNTRDHTVFSPHASLVMSDTLLGILLGSSWGVLRRVLAISPSCDLADSGADAFAALRLAGSAGARWRQASVAAQPR